MSLQSLKETLETCGTRPLTSVYNAGREAEGAEARRPPKTSLREQLASFEHLLQSSVPENSSNPAPTRLKSWSSPCTQSPSDRIVPEVRSALTGALDLRRKDSVIQGQFLQGLTLQRCGSEVPNQQPSKESQKRRSPEVGLVNDSLKFPSGEEPLRHGKRKRVGAAPNSSLLSGTDVVKYGAEVLASHSAEGDDAVLPRVAEKAEKNDEAGEGSLQGSEAGLFIQAEREGPYEPLVLWPPPGEGSSRGLTDDRVERVPASINSRLLPHQREGVRFLYNLYREERGGILGDDMGLGKTIQTIALIAALLQRDDDIATIQLSRGRPVITGHPDGGADKGLPPMVFLILCPTSVLQNWEQEFQAWGTFRIGIYHGANRDAVLDRVEANELEVILTSHDMFRLNVTTLCAIKWDCVIVDEAHRLKNEKSQLYKACVKLPTKRRYGLTGTIMQNKYTELFNVFDWAAPGSLGPREHFREYYGEPLKQGQRISAPERFVRIAEERKKHLVKVLSRHLLRRTKHETIGHLMQGKADNVVFCRMSDVQIRVYRRLLQSPDFQLLISKDLPCSCGSHLKRVECCHRIASDGIIWSYLHRENPGGCDMCPFCLVLPCLTKLQQVSNHLELIKPSSKDDPEKQKKDEEFASVALGADAVLVGGVQQDESFMGLSDSQYCGKMRALENLLATWLSKGDKVLLFSYSVKMLDVLDRFMLRKGYSICRLDGSTPMGMRQALVDEFNNSPSKQVFLISTRAGGLGLNLVSANRVVIFDPNWNPAQDLQAQDRSFRFGQRQHVTVYRLLAAGSIEELVYTRQIYKQQLFNIGVNGTFEKRYFEGVQDSKFHKGELFGISNLFRDLVDEVFTSDIIEKHDQRLISVPQSATVFDISSSAPDLGTWKEEFKDEIITEEPGRGDSIDIVQHKTSRGQIVPIAEDKHEGNMAVMSPDSQSSSLCDGEGNEELQDDSEKQHEKLLKDAGVVYAHRNEEVVNLGVPLHKVKKSRNTRSSNTDVPNRKSKAMKSAVLVGSAKSQQGLTPKVASSSLSTPIGHSTVAPPLLEAGYKDEREVSAAHQNSTQQEEIARFEEMDETSKWLLSASGFYPTQFMQNHSLL